MLSFKRVAGGFGAAREKRRKKMHGMERVGDLELRDNGPLVSVIMPAYNAGKYISEAIRSVLSQSFRNWELLVVDDRSADDTAEKAESFCAYDPRVRLYRGEKNVGAKRSRDFALKMARGEWIAYLDADDCWESDKLQKQLEFAKEKNAEFTYTASSFMNERGEPYGWIMNVPEAIGYRELLKQNLISCSSIMVKKSLLLYNVPSGDGTHEDYALWLTLLKRGVRAYGLDLPLLRYRISRDSKSGNKFRSALMTYRTYRLAGLSRLEAARHMPFYIFRGVKKYNSILKSKEKQ